jgi:hypothetical protein
MLVLTTTAVPRCPKYAYTLKVWGLMLAASVQAQLASTFEFHATTTMDFELKILKERFPGGG